MKRWRQYRKQEVVVGGGREEGKGEGKGKGVEREERRERRVHLRLPAQSPSLPLSPLCFPSKEPKVSTVQRLSAARVPESPVPVPLLFP